MDDDGDDGRLEWEMGRMMKMNGQMVRGQMMNRHRHGVAGVKGRQWVGRRANRRMGDGWINGRWTGGWVGR